MNKKHLLPAILVAVLAAPTAFAESKFVCQVPEWDQTLVLEKTRDLKPTGDEDERQEFKASLWTTELPFADIELSGIAKTSDVHFVFESKDKSLLAHLYLDSLSSEDDAGFVVRNKKEAQLTNCRTEL